MNLKGHLLSFLGILILCPDSLCVIYVSNAIHHGPLVALRYTMNCIVSCLFYIILCCLEDIPFSVGFVRNGRRGVAAGFCFAVVHLCVTYAFIVESTATVSIILASSTIWAAIFSFIFLSEIPPLRTILCGFVCLSCVAYMCVDTMVNEAVEENVCVGRKNGVSGCRDCCDERFSNVKQYNKCVDLCMNDGDVKKSGSVLGLFSAIVAAIGFGLYFVLLRMISLNGENDDRGGKFEGIHDENNEEGGLEEGGNCRNWKVGGELAHDDAVTGVIKDKRKIEGLLQVLPCDILAALFAAMIGACFIRDEIVLSLNVGLVLFVNSAIILPVSFTLLTLSPAYISASEVSLYCLIETVVGPLFVWLGGYESPGKANFIGGSILLTSLAVNSMLAAREDSFVNVISESESEEKDGDTRNERKEHILLPTTTI